MKKIIASLFLLTPLYGAAQDADHNNYDGKYEAAFASQLAEYKCSNDVKEAQYVNQKAFSLLFRPFLSNVFTGSNDLISSSSAASIVQDKDKGTVNVAYTQLTDRSWIWSIGAFAKSKDGVFGLYSNNSWNNSTGINGSISIPISINAYPYIQNKKLKVAGTKAIYYNGKDCESLIKERESYSNYQLERIKFLKDNIKDITNEIEAAKKSSTANSNDVLVTYDRISQKQERIKRLDSLKNEYDLLFAELKKQTDYDKNVKKYVTSKFTTFDTANAKLNGYRLVWININGSVANNTIKVTQDSLSAVDKSIFKNTDLGSYSLAASLNFVRDAKKSLVFLRASYNMSITNFLSHPTITSTPYVKPFSDGTNSYFGIYDEDGKYLGRYDMLETNIVVLQPELYAAFFFLAKKNIGLTFRANSYYPRHPQGLTADQFPKLFTATAGPVFRVVGKDGYSKGTAGVEMGFVNAKYNSHVWQDHFGAQLNIGLPFNTFSKK